MKRKFPYVCSMPMYKSINMNNNVNKKSLYATVSGYVIDVSSLAPAGCLFSTASLESSVQAQARSLVQAYTKKAGREIIKGVTKIQYAQANLKDGSSFRQLCDVSAFSKLEFKSLEQFFINSKQCAEMSSGTPDPALSYMLVSLVHEKLVELWWTASLRKGLAIRGEMKAPRAKPK